MHVCMHARTHICLHCNLTPKREMLEATCLPFQIAASSCDLLFHIKTHDIEMHVQKINIGRCNLFGSILPDVH
jgi:hypothetical protein